MDTMLKKAQEWAKEVWGKAIRKWENRSQDYNYRRFLARPALEDSLKTFGAVKNGIFLDVGCGEGSETAHIQKFLLKQGCSGTLYGFDQQQKLIQIAKAKKKRGKVIESIFDYGQTDFLMDKHRLNGKVDRVFSTFLLQEMPDAESHFKMISRCLKKRGNGVFILVHPNFGEKMLKKKVLDVNETLQSRFWRWVAEYPIVEERGLTFYVPYFQRYLADYLELLNKNFAGVAFSEWQPRKSIIRKSEREKLSPFYNHGGNVYYPEIVEMPSSLVLMVTK